MSKPKRTRLFAVLAVTERVSKGVATFADAAAASARVVQVTAELVREEFERIEALEAAFETISQTETCRGREWTEADFAEAFTGDPDVKVIHLNLRDLMEQPSPPWVFDPSEIKGDYDA